MKDNKLSRRSFLKKAGIAAAGAAVFPYILPSGRLFAATGSQLAQHVVFVLFAGGVRQEESVMQHYLYRSQGLNFEGNVMYNMLNGPAPTSKIIYGTNGNLAGDTPIPQLLSSTIESQGVTLKEVHSQVVGHYAGLNALVTGTYDFTQGLRQKPTSPTIFEYARRHLGLPATKTWFVGNGIGNSVPLLNYSEDANYGVEYAANFIAPRVSFGDTGETHIKDFKVYHPDEELGPMYRMKYFLDSLALSEGRDRPGVQNTEEEKIELKNFFKDVYQRKASGTLAMPPVRDSGDLQTIGYACEVLRHFKPALTVVNLNNVDSCHSNFTSYMRSLHRSDHGVAHLWNYIQSIPEMAGNTAMVIIPEHGRNTMPNPILDQNDFAAYDHSDANSKRVFSQMVGAGVPMNIQRGDPFATNPQAIGNVTDGVLTVAELLGIKSEVSSAGYINVGSGDPTSQAMSMFDRI